MKLAAATGSPLPPGRSDSAQGDASPASQSPPNDAKLAPKRGGVGGWWSSPIKGAAA
jgi:hypothetical protein